MFILFCNRCQTVVWWMPTTPLNSRDERFYPALKITSISLHFCDTSCNYSINIFVKIIFTFVLALVPMIDLAPRCSRYVIFCERIFLDNCPSMTTCFPNNTLGLLLVDVTCVKHLQSTYVFNSVDSFSEGKWWKMVKRIDYFESLNSFI